MKRKAGLAMRVVVLLLMAGGGLLRGAEALLIPEVITREVGIHVGGVQTPEIQYLETREVAIFVGEDPDREVVTREVAVVLSDSAPPPRIEDFAVSVSPTGHTVTLDWSKTYNPFPVRDLVRYDIYYSASPFSDISGMVPFDSVGGESFSWFRMGFPEWQDHYFAVVPVDGQGNRIGEVVYSGAYVLQPEVIVREVGLFNGAEPDPPFREVATREVAVVVCDPAAPPRVEDFKLTVSPTGHTVTLDWTGYPAFSVRDLVKYDIYYSTSAFGDINGMTPFATVGGESFTWFRMGLPEWQDHFFAVVPVDGLGNRVGNVIYSAAYVLMPEVVTRELGFFNGAEPDPPYREVATREVGIVVPDNTVPAPVTGIDSPFTVNISKFFYGGVNLDWSTYDLWSQRDVVKYRIFYRDTFFSDVREPGVMEVPGGLQNGNAFAMITAAFEPKVYYFAVVAEDSSGNINPVVYARSTRDPIPGFMEFALNAGASFRDGVLPISGEWSPLFGKYRYTRSKSAMFGGTKFFVEWSDNLSIWYRDGVSETILKTEGELEHVEAIIPRGESGRRFLRLNVLPATAQP
ncbi:MAG: hypothetical protein ACK5CW_08695 [Verrucomicrobiota bacterium]|jgi:hypothetical protein